MLHNSSSIITKIQYFYENNCVVNPLSWGINGTSEVSIVAVVSVVTVVPLVARAIIDAKRILNEFLRVTRFPPDCWTVDGTPR